MTFGLHLAPDAEADIDDILEWSVQRFGAAVRDGYEALISTAIETIIADPQHPGTQARPEIGRGIRVVHLRSSRDLVGTQVRRILLP